jgi:hypothetical protein
VTTSSQHRGQRTTRRKTCRGLDAEEDILLDAEEEILLDGDADQDLDAEEGPVDRVRAHGSGRCQPNLPGTG